MALIQAANTPLFSKPGREINIEDEYPHVYDMKKNAQRSAAAAGGAKVHSPK